ncbi:MAG: hypothetical protein ACPLRW_07305 [Moorellales bacterium]
MNRETETIALAPQERVELEAQYSPQEMSVILSDMKKKLNLVQRFFREIMVKDQDYGVIPGTDKPTLLKPGAEKLCELYGFAPVVKQIEEDRNVETGFYQARVTVALIHRRSGVVVAEGVGQANTMEGRYRWRWVPEWKLPEGVDKNSLYSEVRADKNGKKYRVYRLENQDPWTLWNTVLKMAKKRALIDATLSATRSSGLFTQDAEDLEEWIEGWQPAEEEPGQTPHANAPTPEPPKAPKPAGRSFGNGQVKGRRSNGQSPEAELIDKVRAKGRNLKLTEDDLSYLVQHRYKKQRLEELAVPELSDFLNYLIRLEKGQEEYPLPEEDVADIANDLEEVIG